MSEPTTPPSPEQEDRMRRLLADARHDGPVPGDVVARLDRVLADLRAEAAGTDTPAAEGSTGSTHARERPGAASSVTGSRGSGAGAPSHLDRRAAQAPVDLDTRRRRRVVTGLVAAAAVVVAGVVAGNQLLTSSGGENASSAGSGVASDREAGTADSSAAGVGPAQRRAYAAAQPPRVRSDTFAADAVRARDRAGPRAVPGSGTSPLRDANRAVAACAPADAGPGRRLPVLLDGVPAVLVLRAPAAGRQVVDLYACGGTVPLHSADLPVR